MERMISVSLKKSAREMPKVWHRISSLSIGGIRFLRYQVEMVDLGNSGQFCKAIGGPAPLLAKGGYFF